MIKENIRKILDEINTTANKVGRDSSEITLIAVSKTFPYNIVEKAALEGIKDFGENYVQDFLQKYDKLLQYQLRWHFIGHLQTNKIKYIYDKIFMLHTLDSLKLAEKLNKKVAQEGKSLNVLIQVNIGKEPNKHGILEEELESFLEKIENYKNLKVSGLMTIPPYFEELEAVRPLFRKMKMLLDKFSKFNNSNIQLRELSMGMSHDFKVAIEEGATMIRIGTSIFGERKRRK